MSNIKYNETPEGPVLSAGSKAFALPPESVTAIEIAYDSALSKVAEGMESNLGQAVEPIVAPTLPEEPIVPEVAAQTEPTPVNTVNEAVESIAPFADPVIPAPIPIPSVAPIIPDASDVANFNLDNIGPVEPVAEVPAVPEPIVSTIPVASSSTDPYILALEESARVYQQTMEMNMAASREAYAVFKATLDKIMASKLDVVPTNDNNVMTR